MDWYIEYVAKDYKVSKEYFATEEEALNQLRSAVSCGLAKWSELVSDGIDYVIGDMKWATLHLSF